MQTLRMRPQHRVQLRESQGALLVAVRHQENKPCQLAQHLRKEESHNLSPLQLAGSPMLQKLPRKAMQEVEPLVQWPNKTHLQPRKMSCWPTLSQNRQGEGWIFGFHPTRSLAIASWNCQGLGNPRTVRRLGEISKKYEPDIIFIMETKNPDATVLKKLEHLRQRYDCQHLVSPTGHGAGGFGLFWKQELNLQVLDSDTHVIDTVVTFEGKRFYSSFVHGSTDRNERNLLWNRLLVKNEDREEPWFLTGDFNDLISGEEKDGGPDRAEGSFSDLRTFFSEGDLFDLQQLGDFLSWRGQRGDHLVRCRLDRAVFNTHWAECFAAARCEYLGFESSDRKPLLSFFDKVGRHKRGLFRYDRRLCKNEEAKKIISEAWRSAADSSVCTN